MTNDLLSLRHRSTRLSAMRVALLTMTALLAVPTAADAQFLWPNQRFDYGDDVGQSAEPIPRLPQHRTVRPRHQSVKADRLIKEATKPQGPVVIAISIANQQLKIYDSNGLFAETPISTGMRGHSTPMGVFSVIGKEKYHRSNIYSGAPMPYMQRITWSGVAMHAGVLPGYPASHGCIRMPMNFAIRMYGWTRMGARVVIAPGELSPVDFSHPLLFTHKLEPQQAAAISPPVTEAQSLPVSTPKSDKAAPVQQASASDPKSATTDSAAVPTTNNSEPVIRTADASGGVPGAPSAVGINVKKDKDQTRQSDTLPATVSTDAKPLQAKPDNASAPDAPKPPAAKPEAAQPKRSGRIAVFISRKEGKLFVRQNFEPLFEVPVTIADGGPLGTHVFTMRTDKGDPKTYRWSVVSMPQRSRAEPVVSRRKKQAELTPIVASASPTEALDRIKVPDDAMQKISEVMASGDSLIVSDLGRGDETGEGTDFIVPLR